MACTTCQNNNSVSFPNTHYQCPDCDCNPEPVSQCNPCGDDSIDSSKIKYTGPILTCSDIQPQDTLQEAIAKLDTTICEQVGTDISGLNKYCLVNPDNSQITTLSQFIESASNYMCTTRTTYNTFITNYNTFVTNTTQQITTAGVPGITNACTGIIPSDTNAQALTKIGNTICNIQTAINPSAANWNNCGFNVGTAPTTILGGFNKLLDYICQVKNLVPATATLPTFDLGSTCLINVASSPTQKTLVYTINRIIDTICSIYYDPSLINFVGCTQPDGSGNVTLNSILQGIINRTDSLSLYSFDPVYFSVANIDNNNVCLGKSVTINPSGLDKRVASNSSDTTPGYLSDKLQPGTGTTLDYTTIPGKVIISAASDHKVLVNSGDTVADYLDVKIDGTSDTTGALSLSATSNGGNSKVIITPVFNLDILTAQILNNLTTNSANFTSFENLVCSTTCNMTRTVQMTIKSVEGTRTFTATLAQNTPSVAMYNSGSTTLGVNGVANSATYNITSVENNPLFTVSFTNGYSGSVTANIYVKDMLGNTVTGSSSDTPTIAPGTTYTNTSFALGTSTTQYVVHVDFG